MVATPAVWLRPRDAAARYRVCRGTLANWARAGLIGVSHVGRAVFYPSADLDALLAAGLRPAAAPPAVPPVPAPAGGRHDWAADPIWSGGTPAARAGSAAQRGRRR